MNKEQKELLKESKLRELLKSLDFGEEKFPVSSVGRIKSLRSIASDINKDKSFRYKIKVSADRDLMMVTIIKSPKND